MHRESLLRWDEMSEGNTVLYTSKNTRTTIWVVTPGGHCPVFCSWRQSAHAFCVGRAEIWLQHALFTDLSVVGTVAKFSNMKGRGRPHAVCRWLPLPREWLNALPVSSKPPHIQYASYSVLWFLRRGPCMRWGGEGSSMGRCATT